MTTTEQALRIIERFGHADGAHHKQWVLDQVARVLLSAPIEGDVDDAFSVGTSPAYEEWREQMLVRDENGEPQYDYDEGVAP